MQGDTIILHCGPADIRQEFEIPKRLGITYSDFIKAVARGRLQVKEQTHVHLHSVWPRTMENFLKILHGEEPDFSATPPRGINGENFDLAAEYHEMDPLTQPQSTLDHIIELLSIANFMQFPAGDIARIVRIALEANLRRTSGRSLLTQHHVQTIFEVSSRISDIAAI